MSVGRPRVAVVGASGAVGRTMLRILRERDFDATEVIPYASGRSAGLEVEGLRVRELTDGALSEGVELALFSAGSGVSAEWAPRFAEAGAVVVDNSSHWRMRDGVPLVVAEVNPEALEDHHGIVANPNCSTMQMVVALKPLHDVAGIERIVVCTYQAVSGTGAAAVDELESQAHASLHGVPAPAPAIYPHPIAFNVVPQVEQFGDGDSNTTEERKMMVETRKILGEPGLRISATCVRVPVRTGHSESVNLQTETELSVQRCRELLAAAPGVRVLDDPGAAIYPLALDAAGQDDVLVGRIREDPSAPRALNLWIVADNLRKGAATNAVQLAEALVARGLLGERRGAVA